MPNLVRNPIKIFHSTKNPQKLRKFMPELNDLYSPFDREVIGTTDTLMAAPYNFNQLVIVIVIEIVIFYILNFDIL